MTQKILFNLMQVLVVMAFAPLVKGVLNRLKERIQSKTRTQHFPALLRHLEAAP